MDGAKLEAKLKQDAEELQDDAHEPGATEAVHQLQNYLEVLSDHVMPRQCQKAPGERPTGGMTI